ncbi:MAG: gamma-glutamyltransferase family protein [Pseudomonadota bacterium]
MKTSKYAASFTSPHYAATNAGKEILEQGGTAIEAMVAGAASIAVNYPHMNGLGGDGFWLISEPNKAPIAINAAGRAARSADLSFYQGLSSIPSRGPKAALTMAGAVAGWQKALEISAGWQDQKPLSELLGTAINQAQWGIEVTQSLEDASAKTFDEMAQYEAFQQFLMKGKVLKKGKIVKLPLIANTLKKLVENGLDDFYRGDIAQQLSNDLAQVGSPIQLQDFNDYEATLVEPLSMKTSKGTLYNLPAPTQGIASLIILGLYDKLQSNVSDDISHAHLVVECTKQAFIKRNQYLTDGSRLKVDLNEFLQSSALDEMASEISMQRALPWPYPASIGDTVWMGACDNEGRMVSYIQSLYWEFGSGIVSPSTGIVWNNRGTSFTLEEGSLQQLQPGLQPFHTLNPAFAELDDGRRISYGTMGGEGQPQTQATFFSRYVYQDTPLKDAIAKGRWLLGRTWGENTNNLKVESDIAEQISETLIDKGHEVELVAPNNEMMGHAGAIALFPDGSIEAATDPRSDGKAFVQLINAD